MASARYICGRVAVDVDDVSAAGLLSPDAVLAQHAQHNFSEKLRTYYCSETRRHWDLFYRDNTDRFFKDRHYLLQEFAEIGDLRNVTDRRPVLLECGCGVGNALYPLLKELPNLDAVAVDFSDRAIRLLKQHSQFDPDRIQAFVHDLTRPFPSQLSAEVDICSLVFVLSAIGPSNVGRTIDNVHDVLKEGGVVVFRDYAFKDMTQVRFSCKSRVDNDLYIRHDGTLSYFFKKDELEKLFIERGFHVISSVIVERLVINRKENLQMQRRWLQCVFQKQQASASV